MSSPAYTNNVPVPTNPPAVDVQNMQNNTMAVNNWVQVDHVGFGVATSGTHNTVTFPGTLTGPQAPWSNTSPKSQIFPKSFGSSITNEELFYAATSSSTTTINRYLPTIKCMGQFTTTGANGAQTIGIANTLYVNLASVVLSGGVTYTITFTTALDYATYYVYMFIVSSAGNVLPNNVRTTSTTNFTIQASIPAGNTVGFMVF